MSVFQFPHCSCHRTSGGHDWSSSSSHMISGQDIFHGGAIELGELLVELTVRGESLSEGVNNGFLVAKWDGDFLTVEASNIVMEWLGMTFSDSIEVSRELLKFLAANKLPNEGVLELSKGRDEIIG